MMTPYAPTIAGGGRQRATGSLTREPRRLQRGVSPAKLVGLLEPLQVNVSVFGILLVDLRPTASVFEVALGFGVAFGDPRVE